MNNWIEFYTPFFTSREKAVFFVKKYESFALEDSQHPAKIMMHQTQRLVSLADDIPQIRPRKESLQLLFLLICAENISKLHYNFDKEGQSRKYTRRFFEELLPQKYHDSLQFGFSNIDRQQPPLTVRNIVDLLYDVRCDVVHEGKYWGFDFHDGQTPSAKY